MIPFGKTLREAREARGYTIAQIAEMTRMMSSTVKDLENENFSKLAAPIYGRGFVKLYCEAVGIDPKPLVAEFMDLYNGNHEPVIRERAVPESHEQSVAAAPIPAPVPAPAPRPPAPAPRPAAPAPEPPSPATPITASEPPPVARPVSRLVSQPGLFDAPTPVPPAPANRPEAEATASEEQPRFARYASPLADRRGVQAVNFHAIVRWTALVAASALVLWGIVAGIGALYRATASSTPNGKSREVPAVKPVRQEAPTARPAEKAAEKSAVKPAERKPAKTAKPAARTPQDIPPLYLD